MFLFQRVWKNIHENSKINENKTRILICDSEMQLFLIYGCIVSLATKYSTL